MSGANGGGGNQAATKSGFTPNTKLARRLRKSLSDPELMLWTRLKARDGSGLNFRCQVTAGPYILDFNCAKVRLAVEIDGAHHTEDAQIAYDEARDAWLRSKGIEIYRIPASVIFADADMAADGVKLVAENRLREKEGALHPEPNGSRSPSPNLLDLGRSETALRRGHPNPLPCRRCALPLASGARCGAARRGRAAAWTRHGQPPRRGSHPILAVADRSSGCRSKSRS